VSLIEFSERMKKSFSSTLLGFFEYKNNFIELSWGIAVFSPPYPGAGDRLHWKRGVRRVTLGIPGTFSSPLLPNILKNVDRG